MPQPWTALLTPPALHAAPAPIQSPTLHLDGVILVRLDTQGERVHTTLMCEARWENPGPPLPAETRFGSVFDGVFLVAVDAEGREIVRQSYAHHQSPYSQGQALTLPAGPTAQALTFPIDGVHVGQIAQVRLEGGLVGSDALSSGMVTDWQPVLVLR